MKSSTSSYFYIKLSLNSRIQWSKGILRGKGCGGFVSIPSIYGWTLCVPVAAFAFLSRQATEMECIVFPNSVLNV